MVSLFMVFRIVFTCLFIRSSGGTVDGKNQETNWSSINSRIMSSLFADFQTCANYIQHTRPYFHQTGKVKNIIIITVVHLGTNPLRECVLKNTYWTTVICQWSDTQFNPMGIQVPCTFDLMFNPSKTWSEMLIHFLKYHWSAHALLINYWILDLGVGEIPSFSGWSSKSFKRTFEVCRILK